METSIHKCFWKSANTFKKAIRHITNDLKKIYDDSDYSQQESINTKYRHNFVLKSNFDKCWLGWLLIGMSAKKNIILS